MMTSRLSARSGAGGSALPDPHRVGVYYAPALDDPLWQAGCAWLGRDAATGGTVAQPNLPGLADNTTDPRRYGLHGTLKAPFTPLHGFEAFLQAAASFAAQCQRFTLPPLAVTDLSGFLALCPTAPAPALQHLADQCVTMLDAHRAPESASAQAKRGLGCTPRQVAHIARWGYPFVFEDFNFHITLTGQMPQNPYFDAAQAYFAEAVAHARQVESLAIFVENHKGAAFRLFGHLPFAT